MTLNYGIYLVRVHKFWQIFPIYVILNNLHQAQQVVVSTAAFHAIVRRSVPGLGGLKETKNVSSPSTCESQYCGEPP